MNIIFNREGNSGKSVLADYLEAHPDLNCMVACGLDEPARYTSALCDQFENYKRENNEYPSTVIFDIPMNESYDNIEPVYKIAESLKNGKLETPFYGKHKRLRFNSVNVYIFMNAVPNLNALAEDRVRLRVISSDSSNFTLLKCEVDTKIVKRKFGYVAWKYVATPSPYPVQIETLKASGCEDYIEDFMTNTGGQNVYTDSFPSAVRAATANKTPEPIILKLLGIDE